MTMFSFAVCCACALIFEDDLIDFIVLNSLTASRRFF
jgi:hypothetical protein